VDGMAGGEGVNPWEGGPTGAESAAGTNLGPNRFACCAPARRFAPLTQTSRNTRLGSFNAHHYRYAPQMSTFIVEVDEETFVKAGFERMAPVRARAVCEEVFDATLGGYPLISNNSVWRRFPVVYNARWSHANRVLIGDALHTAHFSTGSGTRLAMEDAIALDEALAEEPGDVQAALARFEAARRPVLEKLVGGANASAEWYERFADHMRFAPND